MILTVILLRIYKFIDELCCPLSSSQAGVFLGRLNDAFSDAAMSCSCLKGNQDYYLPKSVASINCIEALHHRFWLKGEANYVTSFEISNVICIIITSTNQGKAAENLA